MLLHDSHATVLFITLFIFLFICSLFLNPWLSVLIALLYELCMLWGVLLMNCPFRDQFSYLNLNLNYSECATNMDKKRKTVIFSHFKLKLVVWEMYFRCPEAVTFQLSCICEDRMPVILRSRQVCLQAFISKWVCVSRDVSVMLRSLHTDIRKSTSFRLQSY